MLYTKHTLYILDVTSIIYSEYLQTFDEKYRKV